MPSPRRSRKDRNFLHMVLVGGGLAIWETPSGSRRGKSADTQMSAWVGSPVHTAAREPIIDVHMHAYPADVALPVSLANPRDGQAPG